MNNFNRDDTANRIIRLLKANNRIEIDDRLISEAMDTYSKTNDLEEKLLVARFDAGAYVLEPLFRKLIASGRKYLMSDETMIEVKDDSLNTICHFFDCLICEDIFRMGRKMWSEKRKLQVTQHIASLAHRDIRLRLTSYMLTPLSESCKNI